MRRHLTGVKGNEAEWNKKMSDGMKRKVKLGARKVEVIERDVKANFLLDSSKVWQ